LSKSLDISIVLPAYNESASIARTIAEISGYFRSRELGYEIIVAADGDDGTREAVSRLAYDDRSLKVIGHVGRSGKGRGVREGIALSTGEIVGYADADNKVDIREFEKLEPFLSQGYDVVFGSRALPESTIARWQPWYRQVGSRGFAWFVYATVGLHEIRDTQCGFKFFTRKAARRIFREQKVDGYMFDVEILCIAQDLGCRLKEVPIRWCYDGDSRLDLIAGNIRNAIDIFKIRASRRRVRKLPLMAEVSRSTAEDLIARRPGISRPDPD
jgi:dolichyl-phosphate beta-glucosyltransferase